MEGLRITFLVGGNLERGGEGGRKGNARKEKKEREEKHPPLIRILESDPLYIPYCLNQSN